jgi:hypothetical protein
MNGKDTKQIIIEGEPERSWLAGQQAMLKMGWD